MRTTKLSKRASTYRPYNRTIDIQNPPGRPVGLIRVGDNTVYFTVSPLRNDYNQVVDQIQKTAQLPTYEKSLFYSCFKKWE